MSHPLSHTPFEIRQYPERAVQPSILYLHVGEDIPAAAAQTTRCWEVIVFGTDTDIVRVANEQAARDHLTMLGQAAVAA